MTAMTDWPARDFGLRLEAAAAGISRADASVFEHADGHVTSMHWRRWCGQPDTADYSVIARASGSVLDVGCGPGRLTVALAAKGIATLGIDVTPEAVRLTRASGGLALHRSVFGPVPAEGRWATVLLIDGNIGIGGDPVTLLRRVGELVHPQGIALVEVAADGPLQVGPARIRAADGSSTEWFRWARVPVASIGLVAGAAGLVVREAWSSDGRWFVSLQREPARGR